MGRRRGGGQEKFAWGSRADDYRFIRVLDAFSSLNQKVNLVGVIVEHSPSQRSKGTDYFCSVRIVDDSHHSRGLLVNIFAESINELPRIESSGDIIILSRMMMKAHNKEIYALFNKRFSAFALYEGKYGESFAPYQVSSKFRPREQDKKFVAGLRKWMDNAQLDTVSKNSVSLREIKEGELLDVVCKVIHVCEVSKDELMLFVWDGTDAPPLPIQSRLEDEMENTLPLFLEPLTLPGDIASQLPTIGTVLSVRVIQGKERLSLPSSVTGRWVKFINLTFQVQAGLWRAAFVPSTRIRFVPNDDRLIVKCMRTLEERSSSKWDRMPFTSFPWPPLITETQRDDVPLVTLMDILNYSEVTAKFRCVVRVVAMLPWKTQDFRSPSGIYRIQLTLEDPTARIHAFLFAEDAELFFDGCPDFATLTKKRDKILGLAEDRDSDGTADTPRNPPWILCCVKSYCLDKRNPRESRNYRIFGTRLY